MTKLLVRLFIKDYTQIETTKVRAAYGILASAVGIFCNVLLFGIKLSIGLLIHSISVMADAFNNLSDAASSIISLIGVKLASRPADQEHPFGHGRYEYITAFIVAFLVLQVGFSCLKSSVDKIFHPQLIEFKLGLVIILCISILVKVWLAMFNRNLGKKINSTVMKATAADATGDVMITSATILSLVIGTVIGLPIDGFMGVIVSIFVLVSGFNIAKDTLEPLIGNAANPKLYHELTQKVESYQDIIGTHDLIIHNYGPTHSMATIHAEVPNNIQIEKAHEIIDKIERDVLREMNIFLVIHMDPIEINDKKIIRMKKMTVDLVKELEPLATIHDFRVVNGEGQINLIFDMVVPYSYNEQKENELVNQLTEQLKRRDKRYQCIITLDKSFVAQEK